MEVVNYCSKLVLKGLAYVGMAAAFPTVFAEQPKVVRGQHNSLSEHLETAFTRFEERVERGAHAFKPPLWLSNSHLQTVAFAARGALNKLFYRHEDLLRRELVVLGDGGTVALDWYEPAGFDDRLHSQSPVFVALPTLTGTSQALITLMEEAYSKGMRPVAFLKRGHGGLKLTTPRLQGFGDVEDLSDCLKLIQKRYPAAPLASAGLSAGSALLASYVGVLGKDSLLSAAVVIAPGYDCVKMFYNDNVRRPYNKILLGSLQGLVKQHGDTLGDVIDMEGALNAKNFNEFDQKVYAPLNGYGEDLVEYWKEHCPMRCWKGVETPTLMVNAMDDPVCPGENIPLEMIKDKHCAMLVTTERGGHCGWFQFSSEGVQMESWSDSLAVAFVQEVLEAQQR